MEMASDKRSSEAPHIVAVPIPLQSHVNPMLQFCKRLSAKGLKVTLLIAASLQDVVAGHMHPPTDVSTSASVRFISYDFDFDDLVKMQTQMAEDMPGFGAIFTVAA